MWRVGKAALFHLSLLIRPKKPAEWKIMLELSGYDFSFERMLVRVLIWFFLYSSILADIENYSSTSS
jgi:hypothetical protein